MLMNATAPRMRTYTNGSPGQAIPPMVINGYSVLTVPAYWRAMNFLANNLASFTRAVHQDGSPAEATHPLEALLKRRPNRYQTAFQFWRTLFFHAAHNGNGFARIERADGLQPTALHNLLPDEVFPFRFDDGGGLSQYYYHRPTGTIYLGADVLHLSGLSYDGQAGFDPICLHAQTFNRASMLDRYTTRYLQRGTVIRGAIQIPAGVSEEQVAEIQNVIRSYFVGVDGERDVIVLSDGATLNNATLTPQESQLVEQSGFTTKQISQITGVPPAFLYDLSEGKYNGTVEQAGIDVVTYTFRPWIEQTEDEMTGKLLTPADQAAGFAVKLDAAALMRGDTKTLTDTTVAQVNAGLRTANEGRSILSLPPDADPKSDKLKTLGDSTPKPAPQPAA